MLHNANVKSCQYSTEERAKLGGILNIKWDKLMEKNFN